MIETLEDRLIEFTKIHDEYAEEWNKAMATGNTSAVERKMDNHYFVVFLKGIEEKPLLFNKDEAIDGMRQSVRQFPGAKKTFKNRVIRLKNSENAIVFYEQLIEKDGNILSRLFTIENWQLVNGNWSIIRETEEPI